MNGTVKQFFDAIEEMRTIYNFDDDKTKLSTYNLYDHSNNCLQLNTIDAKTGIEIIMAKYIATEE